MHCQEKVVEIKPGVELELQQRRANVLSNRGPDNQIDGFYVATASELQDGSHQSVAPTATTAAQTRNETSQTRPQNVTTPSQAMSANIGTASDMKVFKTGTPKITLNKNEPKEVVNNDERRKGVEVETMHISCKSDAFEKGHKYGGIIIYQYNGKSEWITANGTRCKSGYIVIQDTDSNAVKQWKGKEPGVVHGAVYRNAFGESINDADVVGEGFAIQKGIFQFVGMPKFKNQSGVLNNRTEHHDNDKRMHEISEHCVKKVVEHWKKASPFWVKRRNFEVKELMSDLNPGFLIDSDMKTRGQKDRQEWFCHIL